MTITPEMLDAMVANGLSREQIVALAKVGIVAQQAEAEAKEQARLARQNERQQRRRRLKALDVTHAKRDEALQGDGDVTKRDVTAGSAPSLNGRPPSPTPQPPTLNPSPTSGSDADASAGADAPPPAELSVSDRIWVRFPVLLAGMSGRSDTSVRTWLGKLLKKYEAEAVEKALEAAVAARTGDPFGYAIRVLEPLPTKQRQAPRSVTADLWAADAASAHHELNGGTREQRPFDTEHGAWSDPSGSADGGPDRTLSQPFGGDPRRLPALRVVGRS